VLLNFAARGEIVDINEILNQIVSRDHRDATRTVGPLAIPEGAEVVDTTKLSEAQVVDHIVARVKSAMVRDGA
jgi:cytidylate kinase